MWKMSFINLFSERAYRLISGLFLQFNSPHIIRGQIFMHGKQEGVPPYYLKKGIINMQFHHHLTPKYIHLSINSNFQFCDKLIL